jgi:hypothetical protein
LFLFFDGEGSRAGTRGVLACDTAAAEEGDGPGPCRGLVALLRSRPPRPGHPPHLAHASCWYEPVADIDLLVITTNVCGHTSKWPAGTAGPPPPPPARLGAGTVRRCRSGHGRRRVGRLRDAAGGSAGTRRPGGWPEPPYPLSWVTSPHWVDRPSGPPHLSVVGHSYGAVVVALAARRLVAAELVLVGSPGARRRTSPRWAPRPGSSPCEFAEQSRKRGATQRTGIPTSCERRLGDIGHGADPVRTRFLRSGAAPRDDVLAHDGYFGGGTSSSSLPPSSAWFNGRTTRGG